MSAPSNRLSCPGQLLASQRTVSATYAKLVTWIIGLGSTKLQAYPLSGILNLGTVDHRVFGQRYLS